MNRRGFLRVNTVTAASTVGTEGVFQLHSDGSWTRERYQEADNLYRGGIAYEFDWATTC